MKTPEISAIFLVTTITLAIIGFTYAHWTETIRINGTVKVAHILVNINSEKVLMSNDVKRNYQSSVSWEVSPDKHTLAINSTNLGPCWYIWVGLVVQNQGSLPGKIKPPEYTYDPSDSWGNHFETTEYFYGSYPEETGFGGLEVWGRVKIGELLNPDGTVNFTTDPTPTPFPIDPTEKAVLWIWIHCKKDTPKSLMGETVILYINIVDDLAI